jgi:hypothetical protein
MSSRRMFFLSAQDLADFMPASQPFFRPIGKRNEKRRKRLPVPAFDF